MSWTMHELDRETIRHLSQRSDGPGLVAAFSRAVLLRFTCALTDADA